MIRIPDRSPEREITAPGVPGPDQAPGLDHRDRVVREVNPLMPEGCQDRPGAIVTPGTSGAPYVRGVHLVLFRPVQGSIPEHAGTAHLRVRGYMPVDGRERNAEQDDGEDLAHTSSRPMGETGRIARSLLGGSRRSLPS